MRLAVIPARGGSKRIPRKNIRDFCGKPIIAYSIDAAMASGLFDRIVVSTDDQEIASVAQEYGAECPFLRPAELADDYATTNAVVKHAIQWLQQRGEHISLVCCLYATSPFMRTAYLKEGHDKLCASDKSFAFSVTSFPYPVQRALRMVGNDEIEPLYPDYIASRSQDLEEAYHDAGQFYWGRPDAFVNEEMLFSRVAIPIRLPRHLVQDIDTFEDWHQAEFMFRIMQAIEPR